MRDGKSNIFNMFIDIVGKNIEYNDQRENTLIATFAKEVMFLDVFFCLCVGLYVL